MFKILPSPFVWKWEKNLEFHVLFDNLMEKEPIHKKKSCLFALAHVTTIVWFDYISITCCHFKFASGLLH
jgi:hypothetical protein